MVYLGAIGKDMGDEVDSGGCWWGAKDATTAITVDDKKDWDEVVGSAKMKVWQNSRLGTNSWVNPEIKQTSTKNIKQRRNQSNIGRNSLQKGLEEFLSIHRQSLKNSMN